MNLKERISYIDRTLDQMYPDPPVPLDHEDSYTLLLAVLLSAQCTDERVNKVTPALFSLANNPRDMARQAVESIDAIVRPCGLAPRKAQAISSLSMLLNEKHQGEVPIALRNWNNSLGLGTRRPRW